MTRGVPAAAAGAAALIAFTVGCAGDDAGPPVPVVDEIAAAIAAVDTASGAPQRYFEISADLDTVALVVAVGAATETAETAETSGAPDRATYDAERWRYVDGELSAPEPVGEATGATFPGSAVDVDPDRVFDRVRAELDDPVIIDFAIQGGPDDTVLYDATVASDAGGVLLVLLGPAGDIRAVQAQ